MTFLSNNILFVRDKRVAGNGSSEEEATDHKTHTLSHTVVFYTSFFITDFHLII